MRRISFATATVLCATGAPAKDCVFSVAENAGLPGYYCETLSGQTAAACMAGCSARDWCKSADWPVEPFWVLAGQTQNVPKSACMVMAQHLGGTNADNQVDSDDCGGDDFD